MPSPTYWQKQEKPLYKDLEWNFPEQKQNSISIIGGNAQSFSTPIKVAEYLKTNFPLKTVKTVLPESLKSKFPPAALASEDLKFTKSTPSGSFDKSAELTSAASDFTMFVGDLSKNSTTTVAIADAVKASGETPTLITRDTIDLLLPEMPNLIEKENLFIIASLTQLQKLFRAVYYPKVLLLSEPLLPIIETLHKFTLSYPNLTLLTFHESQIIVGNNGEIITTPLENTNYSPISLWSGPLAANVAAMNLWNPKKPKEATAAAILYTS